MNDAMQLIYEGKVFVAKATNGKNKLWQVRVFKDASGQVFTQTESWHILQDDTESKHLKSEPKRVEAKNVGRSNETTLEAQGVAEAKSDEAKKVDKGYWPKGEERPADALPLPMLAHSFEDRGHHIKWPAGIQPKIDGVRMVFDGKKGWSRLGKVFDQRVVEHLQFEPGVLLDGELVLPTNEFSFEETISAVKRFQPDLSPRLEYHVFDVVDEKLPFRERAAILGRMRTPKSVRHVSTIVVDGPKAMLELQAEFTAMGYEGAMIRNLDGRYKLKDRSNDLLKHKVFTDAEYEIVDVIEGAAKHMGCAIFVCVNASGQRFNVNPKASVDARRRWFQDRANLIGKRLTVAYQALTEAGVPRFPVGKGIRDYE